MENENDFNKRLADLLAEKDSKYLDKKQVFVLAKKISETVSKRVSEMIVQEALAKQKPLVQEIKTIETVREVEKPEEERKKISDKILKSIMRDVLPDIKQDIIDTEKKLRAEMKLLKPEDKKDKFKEVFDLIKQLKKDIKKLEKRPEEPINDVPNVKVIRTSSFLEKLLDVNLDSAQKDSQGRYIIPGTGGGGGSWGSITGTLSDQTDLQTALDEKVDKDQDGVRASEQIRLLSQGAFYNETDPDTDTLETVVGKLDNTLSQHASDIGDIQSNFQSKSEKNEPNGYAGLKELGDARKRIWNNDATPEDQLDGIHIRSADPTTAEDTTAGYATHDKWINTGVTPRTMFYCDDSDSGTWSQIGSDISVSYSRIVVNTNLSSIIQGEYVFLVDCTNSDIEITIPPSNTSTAKFTFKKIDNTANKAIVNPGGNEQIDYENEQAVILFKYTAFTIESFQSENTWVITSKSK